MKRKPYKVAIQHPPEEESEILPLPMEWEYYTRENAMDFAEEAAYKYPNSLITVSRRYQGVDVSMSGTWDHVCTFNPDNARYMV